MMMAPSPTGNGGRQTHPARGGRLLPPPWAGLPRRPFLGPPRRFQGPWALRGAFGCSPGPRASLGRPGGASKLWDLGGFEGGSISGYSSAAVEPAWIHMVVGSIPQGLAWGV